MNNSTTKKQRVLFIGPHPDDIFISCSGFIMEKYDEYEFDILCMTSKDIKPSTNTRINEEIQAWKKVSEQIGSLIDVSFFDGGIDTKLYKQEEKVICFIEEKIRESTYEYIFTPYSEDTHQDHRTVSTATLSACRFQKNLIFYETPSTVSFQPNLYVEVSQKTTDMIEKFSKIYDSVQLFGNESDYQHRLGEYIYAKLISNGAKSRVYKMAQGFSIYKMAI